MPTKVSLDDLEIAVMWVSSRPEFEPAAFVSLRTGRIFSRGSDGPIEEDYPPGIEDDSEYVAVPHRRELDLGKALALRFIDERAPQVSGEVRDIFHRKGAYGRFKSLLVRHRLLDAWHAYENEATVRALTLWAQEQGLEVVSNARGSSSSR